MNARSVVGATRWVARTKGEAPPRPYMNSNATWAPTRRHPHFI